MKPSMEFSLHGRASRKRSVAKRTLGAQMQCKGANRNMGVLILQRKQEPQTFHCQESLITSTSHHFLVLQVSMKYR